MKTKMESSLKAKTTPTAEPEIQITHEEVAERARAIYEQSGRIPGRDLQNWLAAERQLRQDRKIRLPSSRAKV